MKRMGALVFLVVALMAMAWSQSEGAAHDDLKYWPQWRGPLANGVAPEGDPPVTWSEKENVKWKAKCLGGGQTHNVIPSPVCGFGMVFATSGYRGNALQAITLGRSGDLTGSDAVKWHVDRGTPYVPSPLLGHGRWRNSAAALSPSIRAVARSSSVGGCWEPIPTTSRSTCIWTGDNAADESNLAIAQKLLAQQRDFDWVDEQGLSSLLKLEGSALKNLSGQSYRAIVVPGASARNGQVRVPLELEPMGSKIIVVGPPAVVASAAEQTIRRP